MRDQSRNFKHTRKTLGTLSWVFKEDDYSIVIGSGSPCSGSFSSLLKPARREPPTVGTGAYWTGRVVDLFHCKWNRSPCGHNIPRTSFATADANIFIRSKLPLVTNLYISVNTRLHSLQDVQKH